MKQIPKRSRPSPALILSVIALALALGGTTYAATQLGQNTVGTFQLRQGAVTTSKIRDGAVTLSKLNHPGCVGDTITVGPGCVETSLRGPAGYSAAVAACAALGGRLPFIAELTAIQALGQPLGSPELVADVRVIDGRFRQTVLFDSGRDTATEQIDTSHRYRCVFSPLS